MCAFTKVKYVSTFTKSDEKLLWEPNFHFEFYEMRFILKYTKENELEWLSKYLLNIDNPSKINIKMFVTKLDDVLRFWNILSTIFKFTAQEYLELNQEIGGTETVNFLKKSDITNGKVEPMFINCLKFEAMDK